MGRYNVAFIQFGEDFLDKEEETPLILMSQHNTLKKPQYYFKIIRKLNPSVDDEGPIFRIWDMQLNQWCETD